MDLIARIEKDPEDPAGYAVYGDALMEKGDPLGEIVALAHRVEAEPSQALTSRLQNLQRDYQRKWFGEVCSEDDFYPRWRYGFISEIEVVTDRGYEFLDTLATVPAARFLRVLDFAVRQADRRSSWIDPEDPTNPLPHLAAHGLPKTLRELRLSLELKIEDRVDLTGVWPHVLLVEELHVLRPDVLGILDLPKLRTLSIESFHAKELAELACARLPALATLVLDDCFWPDLFELNSLELPSLYEIRAHRHQLRDHPLQDFRAFVSSPLVQRARKLDLTGAVHRETFDAFYAVASAVEHVEQLVVHGARLELTQLRDLTAIFGERLIVE